MFEGKPERSLGIVMAVFAIVAGIANNRDNLAEDPGPKVSYGELDVHFKAGAGKEDAERLGAFLEGVGLGTEAPASVLLAKANGVYVVSFVVQEGVWNDAEATKEIAKLGVMLEEQVFDRAAIEVLLLDEWLNHKRTLSDELKQARSSRSDP